MKKIRSISLIIIIFESILYIKKHDFHKKMG